MEGASEEANKETLECARYGEPEDLRELLTGGCNSNYQDESGNTALHKASANGEVECMKVLKEFGALHLANHQGNYPIHWAAQNRQLEALKFLFEAYEDVDVLEKNIFGRSTLTEAFQTQEPEIIEACLSHASSSEEKLIQTTPSSFRTDVPPVDETASENGSVLHNFLFQSQGTTSQSDAVSDNAAMPEDPSDNIIHVRELPITRADNPFGSEAAPEDDTTGLGLWPASVLAARWTVHNKSLFHDKSVLELGAGCGLPSLAVAKLCGARKVFLSDIHEPTLENARHNVAINRCENVEVLRLNWSDKSSYPAEPLDVVVGSDLVYDSKILALLVPTVIDLLATGGSFLYVAPDEARDGMSELVAQLTSEGEAGAALMKLVSQESCPEEFFQNPLVGDTKHADSGESEAVEVEDTSDKFILHFYDLSIRKPHTLYHFRKN